MSVKWEITRKIGQEANTDKLGRKRKESSKQSELKDIKEKSAVLKGWLKIHKKCLQNGDKQVC